MHFLLKLVCLMSIFYMTPCVEAACESGERTARAILNNSPF